jgi:hypothetical protein
MQVIAEFGLHTRCRLWVIRCRIVMSAICPFITQSPTCGACRLSAPATRHGLVGTIRKCPHAPRLSGKKNESRQRVTISTPRASNKERKKTPITSARWLRPAECLGFAPHDELKKPLSLTYRSSAGTPAGGASAVPAGGGSSLPFSGGFGKTRPAGTMTGLRVQARWTGTAKARVMPAVRQGSGRVSGMPCEARDLSNHRDARPTSSPEVRG